MSATANLPRVTVIMPARNEARFIAHTLGAVLAQDFPPERLEIVVIDDGSTDGTADVITSLPGAERVRIVAGKGRGVAAALNVGGRAAAGEIVIRVDAHNVIAPDYVRRSVELLVSGEADNAGGRWEIIGGTPIERAIAAAFTSPFGVGGAPWRVSECREVVDTVPFGAYWREALLRLGGWDERLTRNQDYELNWRLRAAGGVIVYDPAIVSTYHVKRGLRGLWRQYHQYGLWKARVIRMHPRSWRWRHLVAPAFAASLVVAGLLSLFGPVGRLLLAGIVLAYTLAVGAAAAITAARRGWSHLPRLPLVFAILHLSWGLGFWRGIVQPRLEPLPLPEGLYGVEKG
ncbi:MAG: glycosyltransferase family 2 protein [Anaerolineae bacterium]|nr:glycosyltransferase family 2 protein [Anaerolineae bacterium]